MGTYLVTYTNLRGENVTTDFMKSMEELQIFMNKLIGRAFTADVMRFKGGALNGKVSVFANTENDTWVKK